MKTISGPAFALGWEQQPGIDECAHVWEKLRVVNYGPVVEVERCERCGVPRCIRPGCRDRRHHDGLHVFEDGSFEPLGGHLKQHVVRLRCEVCDHSCYAHWQHGSARYGECALCDCRGWDE